MIVRVREQKERHKQRGAISRISVVTAGFLVIALGIVLIPLPGPGWVIVAVGLALLALEFDSAERLLEHVLNRLEQVGDKAANAGPRARVAMAGLAVLGAAAVVTAAVLWDLPYLPG